MKKNLFTLFLAVVMIAAVVFVAAPTAQAAEVHTAEADNAVLDVAAGDTVNLSGKKNVTINVTGDGAIYLVDTANLEDLTGAASGSATVNGAVAEYVQHDGFKYLAIKAEDGTYSAHPFNLTVDKYGVNTAYSAVSVRVTVIADNTVAALIDAGEFGMHRTASTEGAIKEYFPHWKTFAGDDGEIATNGLRAYYYLDGSFASDVLKDETIATVGAYIKLDGYETIESNQTQTINPLNILNTLNAKVATFIPEQRVKLQAMLENNDTLQTYCPNFLGGWKLVTDVADLAAGDKVIIVAKDAAYNFALSTTDNGNSRGQAAAFKAGSFAAFGEGVQILTLGVETETVEEATVTYYTFYTGAGYLRCYSSTGAGRLQTEATLTNDGRWNLAISEEGIVTLKVENANRTARNYMQYNDSGIFTCHDEGKYRDIAIYKLDCDHTAWDDGVVTPPTCTVDGYITYTCVCGFTKVEAGEAATGEHSYGEGVVTPPTCTVDGYITYTCSVCGGTKEEAGTPAAGHSYVDGVCSVCGTEQPPVVTEKMPTATFAFANTGSTAWCTAETEFTLTADNGAEATMKLYGPKTRYYSSYLNFYVVTQNAGNYCNFKFPALVDAITFVNTGGAVTVFVSATGENGTWEQVGTAGKGTVKVDWEGSFQYVRLECLQTSGQAKITSMTVNPAE